MPRAYEPTEFLAELNDFGDLRVYQGDDLNITYTLSGSRGLEYLAKALNITLERIQIVVKIIKEE